MPLPESADEPAGLPPQPPGLALVQPCDRTAQPAAPPPVQTAQRGRRWPVRRPSRKAVAVFLIGAAAAWGSLALLPGVPAKIGPGTIEVGVHPALHGSTALNVPPLGRLTAHTHDSPVGVSIRIASVDLPGLTRELTAADPGESLGAEAAGQVDRLLLLLAGLMYGGGLTAGALVGVLVPGRNLRTVAAGVAGAATLLTATLGATAATFDETALRAPTFHGPLTALPALMSVTQDGQVLSTEVTSRLQLLTDQIEQAYTAGGNITADRASDVTLLHVSDIAANPVGVTLTATLAKSMKADAVIDTGDLTTFGTPLEKDLVAGISAIRKITGQPYLFVGGERDSPGVRSRLGKLPGVQILDGRTLTLGTGRDALRLLGVSDPVFTAPAGRTAAETQARRRGLADQVAAQVRGAQARGAQPTILAVHDPVGADAVDGLVPVVLSGHLQERTWAVHDGTVYAGVGSTGAGGLGAQVGKDPGAGSYEAQLLRFRQGRLFAVDYIRMPGATGEFTVTRTMVDRNGSSAMPRDARPRPATLRPVTRPTARD